MATIKDVAKEAGIAVGTVSRVLNNRGYISEETKKRVYDAMEALNYRPNEIARSLFRKKSKILGIIVPAIAHPFFSEFVNEVEMVAYQLGYKILICNSFGDKDKELKYLELIRQNQVDGFLAFVITDNSDEYIEPGMPIVLFDVKRNNIPCVASDHYQGGKLATNLLISKGCKKIAHLSSEMEYDTLSNLRSRAFIDEAKNHQIDYIVEETKFREFKHYKECVEDLLKLHPEIDGIFASSDVLAATVIHVATEKGIKIPEQLKVVGYDDIDLASMTNPSLTTIKQDIKKIGELAVKTLIDIIGGRKVEMEITLPVSLVEREST